MNDWEKQLAGVTSPFELLRLIVENDAYLGYDPYYKKIRDPLMKRAQEIVDAGIENQP